MDRQKLPISKPVAVVSKSDRTFEASGDRLDEKHDLAVVPVAPPKWRERMGEQRHTQQEARLDQATDTP
jgi:hypothetical protein